MFTVPSYSSDFDLRLKINVYHNNHLFIKPFSVTENYSAFIIILIPNSINGRFFYTKCYKLNEQPF